MPDLPDEAADRRALAWGAGLRAAWGLDPNITYLNHGGFGATPLEVLAAQEQWRRRIERDPTHFLTFEIDALLRDAIAPIAAAIGAAPADVVFVENATSGLNAVLRALDFEPGDEILITSLTYPAIRKAAQYAAARSGARLIEAEVPLPLPDQKTLLRAVASRLSVRTRLAIFDHVASHSALKLPVPELTRLAREAGARVMIDGAHAPGMVPLDIATTGAQWYVGNLHKWYFAPRSCGFLWTAPAVQKFTHPLAISHGYGEGYITEFDWTGTRDVSAALAAPAGLDFHRKLGGTALMTRNAALAREAGEELARRWQTELAGPPDCLSAMATIRLPLEGDERRARTLMRDLSERHRIAAAMVALSGGLWVRIAAQAYNAAEDYQRLAAAVAELAS